MTRAFLTRTRTDVLIACVLWLLGFAIGGSYMRAFARHGGVGDFGQPEFGAAVALACGRGFVNFGYDATPAYAKFLSREVDTFSCGDLPRTPAPFELNFTQRLYRYLMLSVAGTWRITGISWSGLWPLFGVMYGSVLACAYGLFRIGIGRSLSVAASIALAVSAIHLGHLAYLRDYGKAPFMLALILLMASMAMGPVTRRRTVGFGIAFGIVLGLGFGFRNDLLIHVPPFLAVVFLCLPGSISSNVRIKSVTIGAAAVSFLVVASPIVRAYGAGSNTGHVAVLGLTTPFDRTLGIRSAMYDWGYRYVDQYAADVISDYGRRVHGRFTEYGSKEYEQEAISYVLRVARQWPADMVARVYASIINIVQMPFTVGVWASSVPFGATDGWLSAVYTRQIWLLSRFLTGCGVAVTVATLLVIAARSVRIAAVLLAFLVYYAGYPVIQFGARHFFHLEFIGWWALAFVLQQMVDSARAVAQTRKDASYDDHRAMWLSVRRAAVFLVSAAAVLVGCLVILRAYQGPRVRALLRGYLSGQRAPLATELMPAGTSGDTVIVSPGLWHPATDESADLPLRSRYILAEFASSATCDALALPITFRYSFVDQTSDFSRRMFLTLARDGKPTRVLFAAYSDRYWSSFAGPSPASFEGIQIPRALASCLASLSQIVDLRRYPMLVDATLTPDWERNRAYQTIVALERPDWRDVQYYTAPDDLVVRRSLLESADRSPILDASARAAIVARTSAGGWIAHGRAEGPESRLLEFRARPMPTDWTLVARGELREGGVAFHLIADGRRAAAVTITQPGPFVVAMQAPQGHIGVELDNAITPWWPAKYIGHRVGPLVGWIPGATLRTDVTIQQIGWAASGQGAR